MSVHSNFLVWLPSDTSQTVALPRPARKGFTSQRLITFANGSWFCSDPNNQLFLEQDGIQLLMVGYAGPKNPTGVTLPPTQLLGSWMKNYQDQGEFQPAGLDGDYSVMLFDPQKSSIAVYRSLVGHTAIYFQRRKEGLIFGTNLAELVKALPEKPGVNERAVPIYFLFRQVPGDLTLFDGIQRLQPGQLLEFAGGDFSVRQMETFEDLYCVEPIQSEDVLPRFEDIMSDVCRDYAALDPQAAGLLSGGVDSTLIQVHWNRSCRENSNGGVPHEHCGLAGPSANLRLTESTRRLPWTH